jgi:hypothetical protein
LNRRLGSFIVFLILATGCTTPRPVASPLPPTNTLAIRFVPNPTLPPTWTPVPTDTPVPTWTPIPTNTPAPTASAEQVCKEFGIASAPAPGAEYDYDGRVTFAWLAVPEGARLSLTITLRGEKQGIRLDIDQFGDNIIPIPLTRLPDETGGTYDWKIWLQHPQYGEICPHTGYFVRKPLKIL